MFSQCSIVDVKFGIILQLLTWQPARMILKADFMTPSEQLFKELHWLPFPKRVQCHTCLMVYKSITVKTPKYISSMLTYVWNTMRGKPGQQLSIYCTFPDHIQPTLKGHFQFKVQNYGIAYQRTLESYLALFHVRFLIKHSLCVLLQNHNK